MKNKIIAIIAVIAIITICLCIGASAYNNNETIVAGTVLEFNQSIDFTEYNTVNIKYESNETQYQQLRITNTGDLIYYEGLATNPITVYTQANGWINSEYRYITLTEDFTIYTQSIAEMFTNNVTVYVNPLENVMETVNQTWTTTLSVTTFIITWLLANQLALCGLYLYILIACIGIGKRFIKT